MRMDTEQCRFVTNTHVHLLMQSNSKQTFSSSVKGAPSRLFVKFRSSTHELFEELGSRHINRSGSQECPNCVSCKESIEHVLFKYASCDLLGTFFF